MRRASRREPDIEISSVHSARLAVWLVALVAIAFLGSIVGIRYVTVDDRWYAAWVWNHTWIGPAYQLAAEHGRLLKPSSYTYFFPYLFDSALYREGLRLGTILLCAWLSGNILQRVVRAHGLTALFVLFFFAFAQNSNEHNLFVAYPFAWEFSWLTWLLGLLGLIVAIDRQAILPAILGTLIWLVGLQEGFVPHTVIHVLVAWIAWRRGQRSWRYLTPYLIALGVWISLWIAWRLTYPSVYAGSVLSVESPWLVLRTMVNYSVGGMPLATLFHGTQSVAPGGLLREISTLAIVKGVAVFAATWHLSLAASRSDLLLRWRGILVIALALVALAFLPNALLAMTPKYQEWMQNGVRAYIYSHFSYFAWTGLGTLAVLVVLKCWPSRLLVGAFALSAACASLVTDAANAGVNRQQYEFARRWETMEQLIRSEAFLALPEKAAILMVDASVTTSVSEDARYWGVFAKAITGKDVLFTSDAMAAQASPAGKYYAYLYDEPETSNQYVLLAPIQFTDGRRLARKVWIYPNTRNRRIHVSGVLGCAGGDCVGGIVTNDRPGDELVSGAFKVGGMARPDSAGVPCFTLDVAAGVDVATLHVDFARSAIPQTAVVSLVPGSGFQGWNTDGTARWNWAGAESQLEVRNTLARALSVQVEFWLVGNDTRDIQVSDERGISLATVSITAAQPGFTTFPIEVPPGVTTLTLRSLEPPPPALQELKQSFQLRDPTLRLCAEFTCQPRQLPEFSERVLGFETDEQ